MARLVVLSEGFKGRAYELKVERTTIGRLDDNAFQIAEPSVSGHHCELFLRGNDLQVKDLDSTNGTFINGQRVTESALKPGEVLRLGQVELRLEAVATTAGAKKPLTQTRQVTPGIKLDDLDSGTRAVVFEKDSAFKKKSNKANFVFIIAGIILGAVIIALIVWAITRVQNQ